MPLEMAYLRMDSAHLGAALLLAAGVLAGSAFAYRDDLWFLRKKRASGSATRQTSAVARAVHRAAGEWAPQAFSYPAFDAAAVPLDEIRPPMYRPFRWGEYHVTMGIRNMHWGEWIELDGQYETYRRIRRERLRTKGRDVLQVLPDSVRVHDGEEAVQVGGGAAGAIELAHELAEYLSRRYPTTFEVTRHAAVLTEGVYPCGWDGLPPVESIRNVLSDERYALPLPLPLDPHKVVEDLVQQGEEAMRIAASLVQDDLAIMVEGSNGDYYFQAGAILVGGFWRMKDKLGRRMDEIHLSGHVPQYKEKLHTSLSRFFRRMAVDKPVVRNNYFVQISPPATADSDAVDPEELAWGKNVMGEEDAYGTGGNGRGGFKAAASPLTAPIVTPQTLRLRTERQTLRRLPRSGAIVFTIRTYLVPVEELAREPGVAARFASAVRSWPEDVQEYKGQGRYRDVLLTYLDEMAEQQQEEEVGAGKPYPF